MMRTAILLSVSVICIVLGPMAPVAQAGDDQAMGGPDSASLPAPKMSMEETTVDLGAHLYDTAQSHIFEYLNTGDAPLETKVTKVSCGCTSSHLSSPIIAPGETGRIEVGYIPKKGRDRTGAQNFTVVVATNDPLLPELLLTVKMRLTRQVEALPKVVNLGSLDPGASAKKVLEINCYRRDKIVPVIQSIETTSPSLSIHKRSFEKTKWGTRTKYELVLTPGDHSEKLRESVIVTSDSDRVPILEIPVKASIRPPVE